MDTYSLDSAMVEGVVEHMNEDHGDACLAIVQALGGINSPLAATMLSIDAGGADFQVTTEKEKSHTVRVPFDKPISRDSQVRGHLVALTKRSRAILAE